MRHEDMVFAVTALFMCAVGILGSIVVAITTP